MYTQLFEIKGKDFKNAGKISVKIKNILKDLGVKQDIVYRTAICCYEAEMNEIMYADESILEFNITPEMITINVNDKGQGIEDISLAMKEGFSTASQEMREMGFGAGMGLPNINKNADEFNIESEPGTGTTQSIKIFLNDK